MLENQELIARLKNGNEAAFYEVVQSTQKLVYNAALNVVQNAADAEDITQDVYLKLFEKIDGFKGDSTLSTWLYRITIRQALDYEKKKKRKRHGGGLQRIWMRDEMEDIAEPDNPGILLHHKEQAAYLFAAIKKLPEPQRIAFTLQQLEGLKVGEVAEIMKRSEAGIESLLVRAKTNLRKTLKNYYEQYLS
ncbi:MAG: RNA polymerase sigma factor [Chitinophagaceae bacterium]|nr:RNA polymerase sigma factor [Bacteroidota bacterium]MCC6258334.1 RNA polymerase sigma factor [Chitinophagaceae bacterium]MCW5916800.1 RNA polymerase sigma factor [Ferruginibacter sp.]